MKKHPWYDYSKLLSYNGVYNFVVGGRGIGKTYGAKKRVISKAIKDGHEFIYLRRYKTELAASRDTFFADVGEDFPNMEFRLHGNRAQMAESVDADKFESETEYRKAKKAQSWKTVGYFIALSTAQNQKSVSYPNVRAIIYDEFIIEKGNIHYLPNEHIAFNNFFSTVDRYQDKTTVLFLANSVSIMNPYFTAYDIRPDEETEFVRKADGFIVVHFPDSAEFANSIYETKFGRFIEGTEYAEYAVGNQFDDNNDSLIMVKGHKARYQFTLECKNGSFSVWYSSDNNNFFVQEKLPGRQNVYTLLPERMSEGKTLMTVRDKPLEYLRSGFNNARVMFDRPATRNTFREIFKR